MQRTAWTTRRKLHNHWPLPILILIVGCVLPLISASGQEKAGVPAPDFRTKVQPILEAACIRCHHGEEAEGGLKLDTRTHVIQGGGRGSALTPGDPAKSPLYTFLLLDPGDDEFMPPAEKPLAPLQLDIIRRWIAAGAAWPDDAKLAPQPRMDFVRHVQPILEMHCLGCHSSKDPHGELNLTTWNLATTTGTNAPAIVPFAAKQSPLYLSTTLASSDDALMPPVDSGGPLEDSDLAKLRGWIAQGAIWPADLTLKQRPKTESWEKTNDTIELIERIHRKVVAKSSVDASQMKDYSTEVPRTKAPFSMIAIKGGEFLMGSPLKEPGRSDVEGPQKKIRIDPFWMGKFEITWDEYEPFMATQYPRAKNGSRIDYDPAQHDIVDAVSQPTPAYTEMSFGMGQRGFPAISMTQHAANKYCQWLSAQTGHFYRLPTEAEWEYACRAGTDTAYSFGSDPAKLGQYAWYYENAGEKYQKVGKKKPNPWGLYDMHGNVMEWTADAFVADYFTKLQRKDNPVFQPKSLYPRSVRGGGWDDDAEQLRSAARRGSDESWKQKDPQLPKSIWYHTDAPWLGFRIVRPLRVPTVEEMDFYWNSAVNKR